MMMIVIKEKMKRTILHADGVLVLLSTSVSPLRRLATLNDGDDDDDDDDDDDE